MTASLPTIAPPARIHRRTEAHRRYIPRARRAIEELSAFARIEDEDLARATLAARLMGLRAELLRSPYYVETLRRAGLAPGDLQHLDDLAHFPLLGRDTLRERFADLPALDPDDPEARGVVAVRSSGSTGQPVTVLRDTYDCLHMWAVLRFWTDRCGVALPPRPRVVLLCSLPGGLEYSVRLRLLDDGALHRISLVRPRPLERLRRAAPAVLFSDPTALHWLQAQPDPPRPRVVLTSAQHFSRHQRELLHGALPVPTVNYYASSDAGPMAWECLRAEGRFHVLLPDVWIESVDGELVVTRLRPGVFPLLRYRTGDAGEVERDACACGYRGWSIRGFAGRRACAFLTPEGRPVDAWQLAWLFKHYSLRVFRLSQRSADGFELEVVGAAEPLDVEGLCDRVRAALAVMGFPRPKIASTLMASIEATGDKPEPFRRLWRAEG